MSSVLSLAAVTPCRHRSASFWQLFGLILLAFLLFLIVYSLNAYTLYAALTSC